MKLSPCTLGAVLLLVAAAGCGGTGETRNILENEDPQAIQDYKNAIKAQQEAAENANPADLFMPGGNLRIPDQSASPDSKPPS